MLGEVDAIDLDGRRVGWVDPERGRDEPGYDRLLLAVGSVNKLLPIPGVGEHAHGFRSLPEAMYLRDHMTRQVELSAATDDRAERTARCTFVVVGAGYTGTEVAAQGVLLTDALVAAAPAAHDQPLRWMLVDIARVLPGLTPGCRHRGPGAAPAGVEVRTGTVGRGGHRRRGAAVRRRVCADPVADLVRRRAARPDGGRARVQNGAG